MRASSSGRMQDGRDTCAFSFFFFVFSVDCGHRASKEEAEDTARKSCENRRTVDRQSMKNRPTSKKNRRKFDHGRFWALQAFSGTRRDAVETATGCPKLLPKRSWSAPGEPRVAGSDPKASPGPSRDAPRLPRSAVQACSAHPTLSHAPAERFFNVFGLSCGSSDVLPVSVFTVFCCIRTK